MIKTKRLELVGFDVKYANDLLEHWSDYEIIKYTYTPLISTFDDCINYIKHQIDRTDKNFTDRFVIVLDNKAIGIAMSTGQYNLHVLDPYFFFSFALLSLIMFICSSVIRVTLFSLAHSTQPFSATGRKILGTFTIFMHASSVNLISGSIRFAAYLTDYRLVSRMGRS